MSGKYAKQKRKTKLHALILVLLLAVLVACVTVLLRPALLDPFRSTAAAPTAAETGTAGETAPDAVQIDTLREVSVDLGNGLVIDDVGSYTGAFMEDGSDDLVSGVFMMVVTNQADTPLQYAEIRIPAGDETAVFTLSTVPAGASVVVLEQSRMPFCADADPAFAAVENTVWFDGTLSLCEDRLRIQTLNGALNITNISSQDITGDIIIYYKNSSADMLYGGITYRVRLEGGLKAGELRQIMASHFSGSGSTVMFVTCGEH